MVENLAKEYGNKLDAFDGEDYYCFPSIHKLAQPGVEAKLRDLGFGYRAKYIEESAKKILQLGGEEWLISLRTLEYAEAKQNLIQLSGIGPKVADCILLMSLDQASSIPVDTHVFQIAQRYLPHLKNNKTVTAKVYAEIGDYFRNLYGPYAGWAHSVLFSADLKHLQDLKQHTGKEESQVEIKKSPKGAKSKSKAKAQKETKVEVKEEVEVKQELCSKEEILNPPQGAKSTSKAKAPIIEAKNEVCVKEEIKTSPKGAKSKSKAKTKQETNTEVTKEVNVKEEPSSEASSKTKDVKKEIKKRSKTRAVIDDGVEVKKSKPS